MLANVYYMTSVRPENEDEFGRRFALRGETLAPAFRRVARYIDDHRTFVLASSAKELAAAAGTSDATVVRTAQALGFSGLGALKQALLSSAERSSTPAEAMRRTLGEVGADSGRAVAAVFAAHDEALDGLRVEAVRDRIVAATAALHQVSRILIFGIGPSAALANYLATVLTRAGRRCAVLDRTGSMLADQLLDLRPDDGLVALAYGRSYPEIVSVFAEAERHAMRVVLVTDSLDPKLARRADVVLPARRGRADRVALHGATLVCLEALALGLAAADRTGAIGALRNLDRLRGGLRKR